MVAQYLKLERPDGEQFIETLSKMRDSVCDLRLKDNENVGRLVRYHSELGEPLKAVYCSSSTK